MNLSRLSDYLVPRDDDYPIFLSLCPRCGRVYIDDYDRDAKCPLCACNELIREVSGEIFEKWMTSYNGRYETR